jgi:hypothetical protein
MAVTDTLGGLSWKELSRRSWLQFRKIAFRISLQCCRSIFCYRIFPLLLLLIDLLACCINPDLASSTWFTIFRQDRSVIGIQPD